MATTVLQVAVPLPLRHTFSYVAPPSENCPIGARVIVPFKSRQVVAVVMAVSSESFDYPLKPVHQLLDHEPLVPAHTRQLVQWAANYYHYPIGQVMATALPRLFNQGKAAVISSEKHWRSCLQPLECIGHQARKQQQIYAFLQQRPNGLSHQTLLATFPNGQSTLKALENKGLITQQRQEYRPVIADKLQPALSLNPAQQTAVEQICAKLGQNHPFLLDGVTGSGKTEVYLQVIARVLAQGRQVLVLTPEINLTPSVWQRFYQRFAVPMALWHSKLSEQQRADHWLLARDGHLSVVIGTRSAIWLPLPDLGLIVVDEEHDSAYKQQEGFNYSARDLAVLRAKWLGIPVILGTATPSLESHYHSQQQRYQRIHLPQRTGDANMPRLQIIDCRAHKAPDGLSQPLILAIQNCLTAKQQVLLFINRRGYAPVLMCYDCGWMAVCPHCDAYLTYHQSHQLKCHHCHHQQPLFRHCPRCDSTDLNTVGLGVQRISHAVQQQFPHANVVRIDSETTRAKHAMAKVVQQVKEHQVDILVGTQMLTKGHHFPKVTLVGVINLDAGLFSLDFRAPERLAQQLVQVAGRAGRGEHAGLVLLQTHHPEHPLLQQMVQCNYQQFAKTALAERQQAQLPPFSHMALFRVESLNPQQGQQFLQWLQNHLPAQNTVLCLGVNPAPMLRRAGRYRHQLLLQSLQRADLHHVINDCLQQLPHNPHQKGVRWQLDIDPLDLY